MNLTVKPYDVVALLQDNSEHHLRRGMVGTVVEILPEGHVVVEFSNAEGETLAIVTVQTDLLLILERDTVSGVSNL